MKKCAPVNRARVRAELPEGEQKRIDFIFLVVVYELAFGDQSSGLSPID